MEPEWTRACPDCGNSDGAGPSVPEYMSVRFPGPELPDGATFYTIAAATGHVSFSHAQMVSSGWRHRSPLPVADPDLRQSRVPGLPPVDTVGLARIQPVCPTSGASVGALCRMQDDQRPSAEPQRAEGGSRSRCCAQMEKSGCRGLVCVADQDIRLRPDLVRL